MSLEAGGRGSRAAADKAGRGASTTGLPVGARLLFRVLGSLELGRLDVRWTDGRVLRYAGSHDGPHGVLEIRDPAAVRRILVGGPMGFAEAYMDGLWDTPDLVSILDLLAANIQARALDPRRRDPMQPVQRLIHLARPNTRRGAKKNIAYHYDLGNDFYRLWLDESMTYSCALFDEGVSPVSGGADPAGDTQAPPGAGAPPMGGGAPGVSAGATPTVDTLARAQVAKWDRLLDIIGPAPGSRLLEIGCGWGGFAVHAARERGCRVTAITLSEAQLAEARERVRKAGVGDLVEVRLQDYRDVNERFDAVASIEMFEAVGERYWPAFFGTLREVLTPGGRAGLQVITIDHPRFEAYRGRADFIQKYIFPGGMLPSPEAFARAAASAGLSMGEPAFFASSYAATLSCWLERFGWAADQVASLGFDERFRRMWRYYLAYCVAGFRNRMIDVMQVVLS